MSPVDTVPNALSDSAEATAGGIRAAVPALAGLAFVPPGAGRAGAKRIPASAKNVATRRAASGPRTPPGQPGAWVA
jgi:hypothetical protein